jgi:hypothetical protein
VTATDDAILADGGHAGSRRGRRAAESATQESAEAVASCEPTSQNRDAGHPTERLWADVGHPPVQSFRCAPLRPAAAWNPLLTKVPVIWTTRPTQEAVTHPPPLGGKYSKQRDCLKYSKQGRYVKVFMAEDLWEWFARHSCSSAPPALPGCIKDSKWVRVPVQCLSCWFYWRCGQQGLDTRISLCFGCK